MPEIQDVFNCTSPARLSLDQNKAFYAIRSCRTEALGSHVDSCDDCGHQEISYNSCRNRHCPKCQSSRQMKWVDAQLAKLLPVGYFHVVFTLPHELNGVIYQNQELLYSILLRSAADTLAELALDPKFLGAQIGVTTVLHTWAQNLSFHPHVHCIVPGGGLSADGLRFVTGSKKFFIPVKVLSRKFRGKFLFHLKKVWINGQIKLFNYIAKLDVFKLADRLREVEWVAFCKKPFKSPWHVVSYLGRYTHRVAIGNSRITDFDGNTVSFKWKDNKNGSQDKVMSLSTEEFVRRFLLHVLPSGFTKIRHYGILSSRNLGTKLVLCLRLIGKKPIIPNSPIDKTCLLCPKCGSLLSFTKSIATKLALDP